MTVLKDLSSYLNFPFAYLLQKHSINELSGFRDSNEYSLLHCAVLSNDLSKVIEIINSNFPLVLLTENSEIPLILMRKFIAFDFEQSLHIPFTEKGYTALHLNLFLLNYYTNFKPDKKSFTIQKFREEQCKILDLFLEQNTDLIGLKDNQGFTLFDYAFLFENIFLINKFFNLDPTFKHLSAIEQSTALKILDIVKIKENKNVLNGSSLDTISEELLINLKKRILYDKLIVDLNTPNRVQSTNKI